MMVHVRGRMILLSSPVVESLCASPTFLSKITYVCNAHSYWTIARAVRMRVCVCCLYYFPNHIGTSSEFACFMQLFMD